MTEEEAVQVFGIPARSARLDEVRVMLDQVIAQGSQDSQLMRFLSALLFLAGDPVDILRVWRAKRSCFDSGASIDAEMLCIGGLEAAVAHLDRCTEPEAKDVRDYILAQRGYIEPFSALAFGDELIAYYRSND